VTARLSIAAVTFGLAALALPAAGAPTKSAPRTVERAPAKSVVTESPSHSSDAGYIYGMVETVDGKELVGQIRWGDEEAFWDDLFNGDKIGNEYVGDLGYRDRNRLRRQNREGWGFLFGDWDMTHLFAVRFGDIASIRRRGRQSVTVTFRNGEETKLRGGSNDIGADITVIDPRVGARTVRWDRLRSVEFRETPAVLDAKMGDPIYGTVKAGPYDFTGRIQWDNDESLSIDKLDGQTDEGRVSVQFGDIQSIRKHRNGALVKLKRGGEIYVHGSNDVNDENRGVVVVVPRVGRVSIGWDDFDEATFTPAPGSGRGYAEYAQAKDLNGTVRTRDGQLSGRIVFDLDESRDSELLHGQAGHTEYLIPFRDIARIKPVSGRGADVELKIGTTIELEKSQDVSRKNQGLLIYSGGPDGKYVPWQDVTEVVFH
jgi:hypothetical protein